MVLPKEISSWLGADDGLPLYLIEASDGGYRLIPYDPAFAKKMAKAERIMMRYRHALDVLAK